MGRDLDENEKLHLETLMDSAGLVALLQTLSEICGEKAEHIRANWQDEPLAKAWAAAEGFLGVASCNKHIAKIGNP